MLEVYADESSIANNRYMVIGGIVVHADSRDFIRDQFIEARKIFSLNRELKWSKVHYSHYIAYRRMVDIFFDLKERNRVHMHSLIVDTHKVDHGKFSGGDRELGHMKFVYHLLINLGRHYAPQEHIQIHLDGGKLRSTPEEFRTILNNGIAKQWRIYDKPYDVVKTENSKEENLIQVADILLGAISHRKNRLYLAPDSSGAKRALANHVIRRAKLRDLCEDTPFRDRHFKIWNIRLQ